MRADPDDPAAIAAAIEQAIAERERLIPPASRTPPGSPGARPARRCSRATRRLGEGRVRRLPARADRCRHGPRRAAASRARSRAGRSSSSCRSASTGTGARRPSSATSPGTRSASRTRRASADVLHCTTMRGPLRARPPVVVTVHDCALLRHPDAFPAWHRHTGRVALRHGVRTRRRGRRRLGVHADELVELLDVPAERIRVVPNGVEPVFTPDGPAASGDYVLAVGTLEPRKNLGRAVEAAQARGRRAAGRRGARAGAGSRCPAGSGRVDDDELAALYRGARCLVFPSLYEGFGLPVLEAMACGTPVVTSGGGATEEVAGGAAVLVDALDAGCDRGRDRRGRGAGATSCGGSGSSGRVRSRGRTPPTRSRRSGGSSHERSARRRRRRRARPPPHRRRDLRPQPAPRAARARRGRGAAHRRRDAAARARPGGHRGDRARDSEPGAADGLVAAAAARRASAPTSSTRSTRCRCAARAPASSRSTISRSSGTPR